MTAELPVRGASARVVVGRWSAVVIVAAVLFCAQYVTIGADTYWAVALGRTIIATGSIPDGIPFAAVPSGGWPNVPVLAELVMAALAVPGPVGIVGLQLAVDLAALVVLAIGARRAGASDGATAVVVALVVLGTLPALASVKLQLFSVLLFPLLVLLLREDHRHPSRRVWWVVPLLALWGNLHGAVLLGVGVTGVYLLFSRLRRRPAETLAVGVAAVVALAVNPAGVRTVAYYAGVLTNEAARRGTELWARPDPRNLFDLLLVVAGLVLVALAIWGRPPLWEVVALVALLAGTATSARHGVWLLMLAATPAACRLTRRPSTGPVPKPSSLAAIVVLAVCVVGSTLLVGSRLDILNPSGSPTLLAAVRQLPGPYVLADEPLAESLAAEGVRVWMSNPIDAFPRTEQAAYLDFVSGNPGTALNAAEVVVVRSGGRADGLVSKDSRFASRGSVDGWSLYSRVG